MTAGNWYHLKNWEDRKIWFSESGRLLDEGSLLIFFPFFLQEVGMIDHLQWIKTNQSFIQGNYKRNKQLKKFIGSDLFKTLTVHSFVKQVLKFTGTSWRCSTHAHSVMCNSYHHGKWNQQPKFKFWTKLFAFNFALMPLGHA